MRSAQLLARAALENARWCDLVCRAHGAPGELHEAYWMDRHPVPPYHPRLVTLGGPERAPAHVCAVRELLARHAGPAFAVKDSFRALDLAPLGFRLLFEAEWIVWPVGHGPPDTSGVRWSVVDDERRLAAWEAAWSGSGPAAPGSARMFPGELLRGPDVVFLACEGAAGIVATVVLHRSDGVVGLCNVGGDAAAALGVGVIAGAGTLPRSARRGVRARAGARCGRRRRLRAPRTAGRLGAPQAGGNTAEEAREADAVPANADPIDTQQRVKLSPAGNFTWQRTEAADFGFSAVTVDPNGSAALRLMRPALGGPYQPRIVKYRWGGVRLWDLPAPDLDGNGTGWPTALAFDPAGNRAFGDGTASARRTRRARSAAARSSPRRP
ncbi:MAG TPA: hypothetical protein VEA99_19865 [Gemmatimonadaceae bacterium]|nr:hypothetical protein [Gemmatimonadaceae bacterium]